jgi:diguanylate cyclase (GGDEF)-like protein
VRRKPLLDNDVRRSLVMASGLLPVRRSVLLKLRPAAALYVTAVSLAGGLVVVKSVVNIDSTHSIALAVLLGLSLVASVAKITIPVAGNDSSLTVCHVVDFTTLIICGPSAAVIVSAFGGWAQCTLRSRTRNPPHRVVFSVAALAVTMGTAGWVYQWLGGQPGVWTETPQFEPLLSAATIVFLLNSILVAGAVAFTTRRSIPLVWFESYLPTWPTYMIGAGLASGIAVVLERRAYWLLPLLAGPLVLLHRNFIAYLENIRHSLTDPLTGLPNQRHMVAHLEHELAQARSNRRQFAAIFVDLDGLKAINDRGGHQAGDAALVRVAECLRQHIRVHDVCARCGGDEFVIVLADCGAAEAEMRRAALQRAVRTIAIDLEPGFRSPLSLSAGVAVYPDDGDTQEQLLAVADSRMYEDKFRSARRRRLTA